MAPTVLNLHLRGIVVSLHVYTSHHHAALDQVLPAAVFVVVCISVAWGLE